MQERTISLSEAQQTLESLSEQFSKDCPAIIITRDNQPLLTIMPYHTHQALLANVESLQTILEIMVGGEQPKATRPKKAKVKRGKSMSWETFKEEVGWE